jgi:hypothetical protein
MIGKDGSGGVDAAYAHRSMDGFDAFLLGRNMFGPIRGPWPDERLNMPPTSFSADKSPP